MLQMSTADKGEKMKAKKKREENAKNIDFQSIYDECGKIVEDSSEHFVVTNESIIEEKFSRAIVTETISQVSDEFHFPYELQTFQIEAV